MRFGRPTGRRRRAVRHHLMDIDGMTVTFGDLHTGELFDTVPYYVERQSGGPDPDFAQGTIPFCTPTRSCGFTEAELWDIESMMRDNMGIVYDRLRKTGAWA